MSNPFRALARTVLLSLPPALVRGAQSFGQDLRSVPARLRDGERRGDPWASAHNVGGGDWRAVGDAVFARLREFGGLRESDTVLDIGCGTGRVARPLASFLSADGGYVGFDVSRRAIFDCRRRFGLLRPDFRFEWADLRNAHYSPGGGAAEEGYRFPADDGSIDLVFATSVFTHTALPVLTRYAAEAARVLKPGGRLLLTSYLWNEARAEAVARRTARVRPRFAWRGSMVVSPRDPESAVAHPEAEVLAALSAAGLEISVLRRGAWAPSADYPDLQDLIVAVRSRG